MNYLMWILVGFIFSKVIKDRFRGWWLQYNFLTSAALDAGLALCTIVIFLTLNLVRELCLLSQVVLPRGVSHFSKDKSCILSSRSPGVLSLAWCSLKLTHSLSFGLLASLGSV